MIIEHNKKVKLNIPTPYPSVSKTKPNPTLGKSTPVPQQVHQHSQDEPTEESPPDTTAQILVNKCLADCGIDPTDIQNVLLVSQAKRNMPSHETPRQIQSHQRYVFAEVHRTNHQLIDRGANGGLAGADMRVIHTTPRKINIVGIGDHELTGLDVVTTATLLDSQKGPIIGVFHEYAQLGKGKSIHAAGQLEWFNCKVDNRSQHVGGAQSIQTYDGYVIPFFIEYGLVYMQSMRIPTDHDLQYYPHVLFTSPDIWDTSVLDHGIPPSLPETQTSPKLRLAPPQGEDQPHDLTSDVFVYGRPNLDESDNTPPISIINFDDFLGSPFFLSLDENGERKRDIISKHVNIYPRLISSNKLTKDHHNGSTYNILIEWETGEQTWETKDSNKWKEATVYDKKHIINAQKGHQKIKVHFVLDVNHCEGDGHFTKELMATVYSGIPYAEPHNLVLWGSDAGHAYNPQAPTRETLYTVNGHECWHNKFYEILHQMGLKLSATGSGTWMKYSKDGSHHEYIAVYVDDLAIYLQDPKPFCDKLREIAFFIYHLGCGHTRNEDITTNLLSQYLKYASMWQLLKPLFFWKGDTDDLNAKTKGSDRIPTTKSLV